MDDQNWRKVLQKRTYDIISHRYGLLVIFVGAILIVISAIHFGETVVEWSTEKYAAVFNSFSDNIASKSFRERLCLPVPIDVVYTWVNGTDPDLLLNLNRLKLDMEEELNISRETQCIFSNCLVTNTVVLEPMLPSNMTLFQLALKNNLFNDAQKMFKVTSPVDFKNFTAVVFPNENQVLGLLNTSLVIDGRNTTVRRCHITSDWQVQNSVMLQDTIIMSGFPHTLTGDELKAKLPEKHQKGIEKVDVYSERGIAVLHVPVKDDLDKILAETNFTIDGKEPTLNAANLVWDLRDFSRDGDISASRFEDNEELRYSLRSIERYAPWVRHVYIVTNGQLPYWLNLENPRVTIVTHDDIFVNKSHLPTFGSPAIESNIHRIPGLSDKFIYMNDDVMFGKPVWPDDFFSYSTGQKVYLTWPVPNCNEGCPSTWIKDGYCDKACNVSECEWDAGDCDGAAAQQHGAGHWQGLGGWHSDNKAFCNSGCANNWMADRYCDNSCNVRECGFDAGDCGTGNYDRLYGMMLLPNQTNYTVPKGEAQFYFNLTSILSDGSVISEAHYSDNKVIRTVAVAKKFEVLTVVMTSGFNETKLALQLKLQNNNITQEMNLTVLVDTMPELSNKTSLSVVKKDAVLVNKTVANLTKSEEKIEFREIADDMQSPKHLPPPKTLTPSLLHPVPANMSDPKFPENLRRAYAILEQELDEGELTKTGFEIRKIALWRNYLKHTGGTTPKPNKQQPPGRNNSQASNDTKLPADTDQIKAPEQPGAAQANIPQNGRKLLSFHGEDVEFQMMDGNKGFPIEAILPPDNNHNEGVFPWEQQGSFQHIQKEKEKRMKQEEYETGGFHSRQTLDTFGDSLRHVNKLYNKKFGYQARKVPGHMPHMIDKNIMAELQGLFPEEWAETSSHKMRSSTDMQYAFSYFYYVMGVLEEVTPAMVFDEMDTDNSNVLSDREIRTLATRLYDLPLDLQTLTKLEFIFVNCSKNLSYDEVRQPGVTEFEVYYEKEMPQVTRNLFIKCPEIEKVVNGSYKPRPKYKHSVEDDREISFKMIKTNVSSVVGQLDDIRKHPKKFICLNDNIDHSQEQAKTVKAILHDFYESILPIQSQFELPREYRNRFSHIDELREWRKYRDWLKFWTHIALIILVIFTVASFFADKIEAAQRRLGRRRNNGDQNDEGGGPNGGLLQTV